LAATVALAATAALGATPSAEQALQLVPIQKDVDFDRPAADQAAKCTVTATKSDGGVGWVVSDPSGLPLRKFVDTSGREGKPDNVVDQWSYYKDGLEVYRDIDSNFNGKADQYRWFHTAGIRWGLDQNEDGVIDQWKQISAEEVTAEIVKAMVERDPRRFARVAIAAADVPTLGLGAAKAKELGERAAQLAAKFQQAAEQKPLAADTRWVQFTGNRPGVVPAGLDGATKDITVYENVMAIVESGADHGQIQIGTLVRVGDSWRAIDVPQAVTGQETQIAGFFFQTPNAEAASAPTTGPSEATQKLLADLEKLDAAAAQAATPEEQAKFNAQRADVLEKIAAAATDPQERAMWFRQLADMVSAATQAGGYPEGAKRLDALYTKLQQSNDKQLAPYVKFRQLMADYGLAALSASPQDFGKVQAEWLKKLEQYASDYPASPDTAEALLQLAMAQEFANEEDEAKKWYGRILADFKQSPQAVKAAGAASRLDSVGKVLNFKGNAPAGGTVDLASYRGKIVLLQFWATWCEPCKADMATLKELVNKYGRSGFNVVGVSIDTTQQELAAYLQQNPLPWNQIWEEGGLDSRPANELGILTLPTMILIDQTGKVVNRNIQTADLDREVQKLIQ
jgi:thiol-disulfide isomerase/thioredoxin